MHIISTPIIGPKGSSTALCLSTSAARAAVYGRVCSPPRRRTPIDVQVRQSSTQRPARYPARQSQSTTSEGVLRTLYRYASTPPLVLVLQTSSNASHRTLSFLSQLVNFIDQREQAWIKNSDALLLMAFVLVMHAGLSSSSGSEHQVSQTFCTSRRLISAWPRRYDSRHQSSNRVISAFLSLLTRSTNEVRVVFSQFLAACERDTPLSRILIRYSASGAFRLWTPVETTITSGKLAVASRNWVDRTHVFGRVKPTAYERSHCRTLLRDMFALGVGDR